MLRSFFLRGSEKYLKFHVLSLILLLLGELLEVNYFVITWYCFSLYGLSLYLLSIYENKKVTLQNFSSLIPFGFSMIAATWLVAGELDLELLGYDQLWSFLAVSHSTFLGWILIGCFSFTSNHYYKGKFNIYLLSCYLIAALFLFIAFGINGINYLKEIAVPILTVLLPGLIAYYVFVLIEKKNKTSYILGLISFSGIILTMILAFANEFTIEFIDMDISKMVYIHGLMNALIVIPSFFFALRKSQYFRQ